MYASMDGIVKLGASFIWLYLMLLALEKENLLLIGACLAAFVFFLGSALVAFVSGETGDGE